MSEFIKLEEIKSEDNRKYTKDESFEQLISSIRKHGLIEQPVLRKLEEGGYRIIAGRRRIAAVRRLNEEDKEYDEVECTVLDDGDSDVDEEIALAENVNRLEMHPLDEAALFGRMAERGAGIEEIAKHYARSPSAIYKRLRLTRLAEGLKGMFRDGRLNIAGAAVLAELPEEDQKDFYETYGKAGANENIEPAQIGRFIQKKQRYTIKKCMKGCEKCGKRTHNENNTLFEEYSHFDDVCLDADCYRVKWYEMIGKALEKQIQQTGAGNTDYKVYFSGGIPEMLYKKADLARFPIGKTVVNVEVISDKGYEFTGATSRKKDTCWKIFSNYFDDGEVVVQRIGYKAKEPKKKPVYGAVKSEIGQEIKNYGSEVLEAIVEERQMPSAQVLVQNLKNFKIESYNFKAIISNLVTERVIAKKIEEEQEVKPVRNYLPMFLQRLEEENYGEYTFEVQRFDDQQKKWLRDMFGNRTMAQITVGLSDEAQKLIHFLLLASGLGDAPDLDEAKEAAALKNKNNLFWNYADMDFEEYKALYLEAAKEAAAEALEPKAKKNVKKKKAAGKKKEAEPEEDEEDNYPFEPDIEDDGEETD